MLQYLTELVSSFFQLVALWLVIKTCLGIYRHCLRSGYNLKQRHEQNAGGTVWACITGGTDGLGLAYCKILAERGFNIAIISRNPQKLQETQISLKQTFPQIEVKTIEADFSKFNENQNPVEWFQQIDKQIESLDIGLFINNAAWSKEGGLRKLKPSHLRAIIDVNTTPYAMLLRGVIPRMLERTSRAGIINVSSLAADIALPGLAAYTGSKKFNENLSLSLAAQFQHKLDILCVKPLFFATKLNGMNPATGRILTAKQVAEGSLKQLGKEYKTHGHWIHCLQGSIGEIVLNLIPQSLLRYYSEKNEHKNEKN